MKTFKSFLCYCILTTTILFIENSIAKRVVRIDLAFYTCALLKDTPVDKDGVTESLKKTCDGTESCHVYLKVDDKFNKSHPSMDLHINYHCEENGRRAENKSKVASSNAGLVIIGCPPIQPHNLWDSITSFTENLLKSLSSSNSEPIATPAEAAPLMGGKHKKED